MNIYDLLILCAVAPALFLALRRMRRNRKAGCSGCCAACDRACSQRRE